MPTMRVEFPIEEFEEPFRATVKLVLSPSVGWVYTPGDPGKIDAASSAMFTIERDGDEIPGRKVAIDSSPITGKCQGREHGFTYRKTSGELYVVEHDPSCRPVI